jgi:hypothetical protein
MQMAVTEKHFKDNLWYFVTFHDIHIFEVLFRDRHLHSIFFFKRKVNGVKPYEDPEKRKKPVAVTSGG